MKGDLVVTVTTSEGTALAGVTVTILGTTLDTDNDNATTDSSGVASFKNIGEGQYNVSASREGFTPEVKNGVTVAGATSNTVALALKAAPGGGKLYVCKDCGANWTGTTNRRAARPLESEAVEAANKEVWTKCAKRLGTDPKTGKGRKLTMSSDDYLCRRKWMDAYLKAVGDKTSGKNGKTKKGGKKPDDPKKKCGMTIESETVAAAPGSRKRTKIGVAEKVKLTIKPPTVGSVAWSVTGGGTLSPAAGTSTVFTAGDRTSTSKVQAMAADGSTCEITFTVVEPSGAYQVQFGKTLHRNATASVGFRGITYLLPKEVSFENIEINEGTCVGVGTGCLAGLNGKVHPVWPSWATVSKGDSAKGCHVEGPNKRGSVYYDFVYTQDGGAPFTAGTFKWVIPWQFRVSGGTPKEFTKLTHDAVCAVTTGKTTQSKGGVTVSAMPAEPTEN